MAVYERPRESREWWVIAEGRVTRAVSYSCSPANPDTWWFPTLGFSACEGFHVFTERADAVQRAVAELQKRRDTIDAQMKALQNG
jgi:hypothetical protein